MDQSDKTQQQQNQQQPVVGAMAIGAAVAFNSLYQTSAMVAIASPAVTVSSPTQPPTFFAASQNQFAYHQSQHFNNNNNQQPQQLQAFWANQMQEIEQATDFKNHSLPLARIKKIMKADEDVRRISAEAPVIFAKACEMFILGLTFDLGFIQKKTKGRLFRRITLLLLSQELMFLIFWWISFQEMSSKRRDLVSPKPTYHCWDLLRILCHIIMCQLSIQQDNWDDYGKPLNHSALKSSSTTLILQYRWLCELFSTGEPSHLSSSPLDFYVISVILFSSATRTLK